MSKRETKSKTFFDSLTRNAINFLEKSVEELERSPKYSVIHFCSAIELFFKARLLVEHWSIIVSKPETANLAKFKVGDFNSVNMQEAINRLENISAGRINEKAKAYFKAVRDHRNKLVHFFHEKYLRPDEETLREIIPEQCSAWYYLHSLLTSKWRTVFEEYLESIEKLNYSMHRHKDFLKAKFDELKEDIEKEKSEGIQYVGCFFCNFPSARVDDSNQPLHECVCRVCGMNKNYLIVECPVCGNDITVEDSGDGECEECGYETDIDFLISKFGPFEDPKEEPIRAYCGICEYISDRTVVPFNGGYLCLNCLEMLDEPEHCDWCNELVAGMDLSGSYLSGCVMCDGHGDWKD